MAIINENTLFDKLKEYIDKKIGLIETNLKDIFDEYGLKEILPYLNEIKTVADNIEIIQPIGEHITDIIECADNIDYIIAAPDYVDQMIELTDRSQELYEATLAAKLNAFKWSQEEFDTPVDDGEHQGYSSLHWATISKMYAEGLEFMGMWNPNDGSYPDDPAHGRYWIVSETGWFDGVHWLVGDKLIYLSTPDLKGWYRVPNIISWNSVFDKPSMFTPKPHYHSEYQQIANMTDYTEGPHFQGLGVKLNAEGVIDNSMIKLPIIYLVGSWTPITGNEYPDTDEYTPGAVWIITGLQWYGYIFTDGDLIGKKTENGDYLILTEQGWHLRPDDLYPELYYKRDGSYPMTGDANFGRWRGINVGDPIDPEDAVNLRSLDSRTGNFYAKDQFVDFSYGQENMYAPVRLNRYGLIDASMLTLNNLVYQGGWNPSGSMGEYPNTNTLPGYFWDVFGVDDDDGYTFSTGDLAGKTVFDGYYMVWGQVSWSIIKVDMTPNLYYKLDGSTPLSAPFNAGNQRLSLVENGVADTDAVTVLQMNNELSTKAPLTHIHGPGDIQPQGVGSLFDADMLDGHHAIDFAEHDHTHAPGEIQPQGADSGLDADTVDGVHASGFLRRDIDETTSGTLSIVDGEGALKLEAWGGEFSRDSNYIRPTSNGNKNLYLGGDGTGLFDWQHVKIYSTNPVEVNNNQIWDKGMMNMTFDGSILNITLN